MTQTIYRPGFGPGEEDEEFTPNGGRVPRLSGDIRHLIPRLGLREYWYPLCGVRRLKRTRPMRVRMLGEDLCVFRGRGKDEVHALTDICPHRGARLSEGACHFAGTVACSYHGWVFDGEGRNVAVLSEGPNSIVCGKPGTDARSYPTQVLKGIVWAWMGDGEPAPIEEDVPEEFFDPRVQIFFNDRIYWKTNWEVALENSMDAHVQYLHRDNLSALTSGDGASPGGGSSGMRPIFTGNGFRGSTQRNRLGQRPLITNGSGANGSGANGSAARNDPSIPPAMGATGQAVYAQGWKWPKNRYRKLWSWFFGPLLFPFSRAKAPLMKDPDRWVGGHHLPGMFRAGGATVAAPQPSGPLPLRWLKARGGPGLYALYTRQTVPVDEWLTRVWYHHSTVPRNKLELLWFGFLYFSMGRWFSEYNFSQQDMSVMLHQVYDAPEKLSGTDAEVVQWRKLVVTKHFGGRDHSFEYENPQPEAVRATATAGSGDG